MKTVLNIILTLIFASLCIPTPLYAGVAGYDGTNYKGVFSAVQCSDGLLCSKNGSYLKVQAAPFKAASVFTSGDTTPAVITGGYYLSFPANTVTITNFTGGYTGEQFILKAQGAVTLTTGASILCGSVNLVLASGDVTTLVNTGGQWQCTARTKASGNLN